VEESPTLASDNRTLKLNGAKLAELRRVRGLSREQLADAAEGAHRLSVATIKRAEHGAPVYLETARRLAGLLNVSVQLLIEQGTADSNAADSSALELLSVDDGRPVGVAVLPFRVIGEDIETRLLAHGIVEDLTTRLGNWWFPVICRASTFDYNGGFDHREAAEQLRVGYFVEGSVQRRGNAVRVHARLVAARSLQQVWAAEYNRAHATLFALQDELTCGIIDGVNHKLLALEARRIEAFEPSDLEAWQLAVRGTQLFYERRQASNAAARELLHTAVNRDANLTWAYFLLALTYQQEIVNQWSLNPRETLGALAAVASEFERHHRGDARADVVMAYLLVYQGKRSEATDRLRRAIESAPNLHIAYSLLGQTLAMANDPDPAIEHFELAMRLSPRDADLWSVQTAMGLAHFVAERYDAALSWAEKAAQLRPDIAFTFGTVASASALAGDLPRARAALEEMVRLHPAVSMRGFEVMLASTQPDIAARYISGLRSAGFAA